MQPSESETPAMSEPATEPVGGASPDTWLAEHGDCLYRTALMRVRNPDMSRLSSQAMDTRLPWATRFRMRVHYLICGWCRRYRAQFALLRRAVSRLGNDAPGPGPALPPEARERIRKNLCDHGRH